MTGHSTARMKSSRHWPNQERTAARALSTCSWQPPPLDGQVMHVITQDGVLWRTLPCPIPPGQRHKLQGVRLAGPEPLPPQAQTVQRKVSSRGGLQVARQRIQVGFRHAGTIVTIELGDTTLRVIDQHCDLITTVPRASTGEISRFKAYGSKAAIPARTAATTPATRKAATS